MERVSSFAGSGRGTAYLATCLLFVFVSTLTAAGQASTQPEPSLTSEGEGHPALSLTIEEVKRDADGDKLPDRIGNPVTVRGRATTGVGLFSADSLHIFLQDATSGIRLVGVNDELAIMPGDSLVADGIVRSVNREVRLEVVSVRKVNAPQVEPQPLVLQRSTTGWRFYEGMLVQVSGDVIARGIDHDGPFFVINRRAGALIVRPASRAHVPETVLRQYDEGDHIRITGVLAGTGLTGPHVVAHQVIARQAGDIQYVPMPPWLLPWLLLGGLVLLLIPSGLMLRRYVRNMGLRAGRYRTFFEKGAGTIVLCDTDFRILDANVAAHEFLNASGKSLRFKPLPDLLKRDGSDGWEKLREELLESGTATFEGHLEGRDHSVVDVRVTLRRLEVDGYERIAASITDMTESRERFRLYEAFLEKLLDDMPIQVSILAPDGKYHYVNPEVAEDERVREWLIGKSDFEYCKEYGLHAEVALRRRAYRKQAVDRKVPVTFEETIITRSGDSIHFVRVYSPHVAEDGEVSMVACFGIDLTELKRYRAEVDDARAQVAKTTRLKEAFLQNVSHEFRTPLTGIVGFSQILKEEVPAHLREFIENIESSGNRLMDTLNMMLDMAGLKAEQVEMRPQVLNIVAEVEEAVRALRPEAEEKGLFLRVQAQASEILARLDAAGLHRVLRNLIGNAVKFTEAGGVIVEVSRETHRVCINVMDSGVGIERTFMPELFEEFNQEEPGVSRPFEGVGLGLAVTERLVRLMQGEVRVQSDKGEGSMFAVSFPISLPGVSGSVIDRPHVLVADRTAETHRVVRFMLDDHFQVTPAIDLAEALTRASERLYEAVLVDVALEDGMDASELLARLREVPGYERVPIIAADSRGLPGAHHLYVKMGFDHHVSKPLRKLALLDVLVEELRGLSTQVAV